MSDVNIDDDLIWSKLSRGEKFAAGLRSLRRIVALAADDRIERVFRNIAIEVRGYVGRGLDRGVALAALVQIAAVRSLDADRVDAVIAAAFGDEVAR
jgi:DNA-binding NarL/FixJ family response regulator